MKQTNFRILLLAAAVVVLSNNANATAVTYAFTGTWASGSYTAAVGSTVTGYYSFDDAGADSNASPGIGLYPASELFINVSGLGTFTGTSSPQAQVRNDTFTPFCCGFSFYEDSFTLSTGGGSQTIPNTVQNASVLLRTTVLASMASTVGVLANDSLGGVPHNPGAWDEKLISITVTGGCAFCSTSTGGWNITSIAAVPEPSSYILMAGGLAGLAAIRRYLVR